MFFTTWVLANKSCVKSVSSAFDGLGHSLRLIHLFCLRIEQSNVLHLFTSTVFLFYYGLSRAKGGGRGGGSWHTFLLWDVDRKKGKWEQLWRTVGLLLSYQSTCIHLSDRAWPVMDSEEPHHLTGALRTLRRIQTGQQWLLQSLSPSDLGAWITRTMRNMKLLNEYGEVFHHSQTSWANMHLISSLLLHPSCTLSCHPYGNTEMTLVHFELCRVKLIICSISIVPK